MSNPKSKDQRVIDRRRFLTTFALGATAAPLLSLGRSVFARGDAASQGASLCYSTKRVIGPSDLRYLGAMRMPSSGIDIVFSQGTMTGRKVNGQVRLLMAGSRMIGDPIYELAD